MDEDDERSAFYNSVQDPSADDSVSPYSCVLARSSDLSVVEDDLVTDPVPSLFRPYFMCQMSDSLLLIGCC